MTCQHIAQPKHCGFTPRAGREPGQILVEWDPFTFSILTEDAGSVKYKDLITDVTYHEEVDEVTGLSRKIVVDSPDKKKQPMIEVRDKAGKVTRMYHMPSHAHLMVEDNEAVFAGQVLAKIPRETTKTKDITGDLHPTAHTTRREGPGCRSWSSYSRRGSRVKRRSSRRSTASSASAASSRGSG